MDRYKWATLVCVIGAGVFVLAAGPHMEMAPTLAPDTRFAGSTERLDAQSRAESTRVDGFRAEAPGKNVPGRTTSKQTPSERNEGSGRASPLATGACCTAAVCASGVTDVACEAGGGYFLGDGSDCAGSPCDLGACCTDAGGLIDCDDAGGTMDESTCGGMSGTYVGGAMCEGGPDPCPPACAFEDSGHCQLDNGNWLYVSDRNIGVRRADDFRPDGTLITRVCFDFGFVLPGGNYCADDPPDDNFEVRFYDDDFGFPGAELANSPGAVTVDTRKRRSVSSWSYSAPIIPGVTVVRNNCYWIEITGSGDDCRTHWVESTDGNSYGLRDYNLSYGQEDIRDGDTAWCIDTTIVPATIPGVDGGCGDIPMACCRLDEPCAQLDSSECLAIGGYGFPYAACGTFTCPFPENDLCDGNGDGFPDAHLEICAGEWIYYDGQAPETRLGQCEKWPDYPGGSVDFGEVCDPILQDCISLPGGNSCIPWDFWGSGEFLPAYECYADVDNRLAATDGPTAGGDCFGSGINSFQRDVWQTITAPCSGKGTITMCSAAAEFDSMLGVFSDHSDSPHCPGTGNDNGDLLYCNDDYCSGPATVSGIQFPAMEGAVYIVRTGAWSNEGTVLDADQGSSEMHIGFFCSEVPCGDGTCAPAETACNCPADCPIGDDCDGNGIDDACETADGSADDCNNNGSPDACDVPPICPGCPDCNANGIPDVCEDDCQPNGIPDECDVPPICPGCPDCNTNGIPDACEADCQPNGIPDDCDVPPICPGCPDCNTNGTPDACEDDCQPNGIPDDCDILACPAPDLWCKDCNANDIPDGCDILSCPVPDMWCKDCQPNSIPDECDIANCGGGVNCDDCDLNEVPDECDPSTPPAECCFWIGGTDTDYCNPLNWPEGCACPNNEGKDTFNVTIAGDDVISLTEPITTIDTLRVLQGASFGVTGGGTLEMIDAGGALIDGDSARRGSVATTLAIGAGDTVISTVLEVKREGRVTVEGAANLNLSATLTVGPGGAYEKEASATSVSASLTAAAVEITDHPTTPLSGGQVTLSDTMTVDTDQMLVSGGGALLVGENPTTDVAGALTIGAAGTYQKDPTEQNASSASLNAGTVDILGGSCSPEVAGGAVLLTDKMSLVTTGDLTLAWTPDATCTPSRGGCIPPPPRLSAGGGARAGAATVTERSGAPTVHVGDSLIIIATETCIGVSAYRAAGGVPAIPAVTVEGDFINHSTVPESFNWSTGGLGLVGPGPHTFEVTGTNRGAFYDTFANNFAMGSVQIDPGAVVTFVDEFDNDQQGQNVQEALYVDHLVFGVGSTVTISNCSVFYKTLTLNDVSYTLFGSGELREASPLLSPSLPSDPTHQVRKNRYLSIDPSTNPGEDSVIKVEVAEMRRCRSAPTRGCMTSADCDSVCNDVAGAPPYHTLKCPPAVCSTTAPPSTCIASGPCVNLAPTFDPPLVWFVQQPVQDPTGGCKKPGCPPYPDPPAPQNCCEDDDWMAYLGATVPELTGGYTSWSDVWADLPAQVLHITDCRIVPATTYAVYACNPENLDLCSRPLMISTAKFPVNDRPIAYHLYADVCGGTQLPGPTALPPDGYVSVKDLQCENLTIINYGGLTLPQMHMTWADLHGVGTGIPPNYNLSVADLMAVYVFSLTDSKPYVNTQGGLDLQDCP